MTMERKLLLLRHAKAEVADAHKPDHDRVLTTRGTNDARKIAQYFSEHQIDPDVILCSTSARTRQTEQELRANTTLSTDTLFLAGLYLAPWEEIEKTMKAFATADTRTLLVIGHNPGLEECAARLTGELVLLSPGAMAILGVKGGDFDAIGNRACSLLGVVSAKSLSMDDD